MDLDIVTTTVNGSLVVTVAGEVDLATAPQLSTRLQELISPDHPVLILRLNQVSFLDSVGISVLVDAHNRARRTGTELRLAAPHPIVAKVLQLTAVDTVIPTYPTLTAAAFPGPDIPS